MNPAQALHVLKQTAEKFVGTRQDHQLIDTALATLGDFIVKHQPPAPAAPEAPKPEETK